jgi:Sulfotransferase family
MSLPTFFIIGAPKAGTTSLHNYLAEHPEIHMSAVKEPRFFAGPENGLPYPPDWVPDLDDYERLFDSDLAIRGESSTDYAIHPRRSGAPERIKSRVPEAKFVYMVRDPIKRTISHYRMIVALMGEQRSLAEVLGDLDDLHSPYISASLYAAQLEQYLRHFASDRILVVDQADLLGAREATLSRIFAFLGADPSFVGAAVKERHLSSESWRAYPRGYADFITRYAAPAVRWVPVGLRRSVRAAVERRIWQPIDSAPEADLLDRMAARFGPEAERLRELTGESFPTWSV